jgi:hypothetical protein
MTWEAAGVESELRVCSSRCLPEGLYRANLGGALPRQQPARASPEPPTPLKSLARLDAGARRTYHGLHQSRMHVLPRPLWALGPLSGMGGLETLADLGPQRLVGERGAATRSEEPERGALLAHALDVARGGNRGP